MLIAVRRSIWSLIINDNALLSFTQDCIMRGCFSFFQIKSKNCLLGVLSLDRCEKNESQFTLKRKLFILREGKEKERRKKGERAEAKTTEAMEEQAVVESI